MNADIARRKFISALARAWDCSLDLQGDDKAKVGHTVFKIGELLEHMAPGRVADIVERREREAS